MQKWDKYIDLTRYLKSHSDEIIEMTFEAVANIVGGLPPSAYKYQAYWSDGSQGSLSTAWLNAGYSARVRLADQIVVFAKSDVNGDGVSLNKTFVTNRTVPYNSTLDVTLAVEKIQKYHATTQDSLHTRYRSWEHCYSAFASCPENPNEEQIEYLSLHLAWYLASWGMLRNSFLMNHDYLVHKSLISRLMQSDFTPLFSENKTEKCIVLALDAAKLVQSSYPVDSVTDTFITKILLGIFGSAPAYDRFFKEAARKYSICSGTFSEKSLRQLWAYYQTYYDILEPLRVQLSGHGVQYTPMKIMDMCLWQIGFDDAGLLQEISR